jgi:hypothetical protein
MLWSDEEDSTMRPLACLVLLLSLHACSAAAATAQGYYWEGQAPSRVDEPIVDNTVSYYPDRRAPTEDIDLARFRQLAEPEGEESGEEGSEAAVQKAQGEAAKAAHSPAHTSEPEPEAAKEEEEKVKEEEIKEKEEEVAKEEEKKEEEIKEEEEKKEEEKAEQAEAEKPAPSRPEQEAERLEKEMKAEDEVLKGYDREALKDQMSRNMHIVGDDTEEENKDKELSDALQAVKDQIVYKANQIKSEKRWVREVTAIIESYVKKTRRVNANIRNLQAEVKELFRKKKQIENMILQRKLELKLKVANTDLETLKSAIKNVREKEMAFSESRHQIRATIGAIEAELAKLRNEPAPAQLEEEKHKKEEAEAGEKKSEGEEEEESELRAEREQ